MKYLYMTKEFTNGSTWVVRLVLALMAPSLFFFSNFGLSTTPELVLSIVIGTLILIFPVDDLAFSNTRFFHLQRSLMPFLSRVSDFEIAKIKDIRIAKRNPEPFRVDNVHITIVFNDGTSKMISTRIERRIVRAVAKEVLKIRDGYKANL